MKTVTGDLIQLAKKGKFDLIVHGCNCHCRMGSGIAKAIRAHFPEAYKADCKTAPGDRSKLGTYTSCQIATASGILTVVNGYTQFDYGTDSLKADYSAIRNVIKALKKDFAGQRIGYPKIGAGLAGGDWPTIESVIEEELQGEDHTLVIFDQS
ncbi:macro domain-containing protein [Pelagicoccus enzymogenes]|uniref:macro domain-containing protein n=1 Tax=Pelagicoccus enzymogenes TaxID=2773457 RepID=UPI0028102BAD|nr:macro domain-containing protein [Pelagicoccus enzymogenes]MDQ8199899.1 macro domain-containing protein [Pelagicoccus enzymogenes]